MSETESRTLAEAFPIEQARCRELLGAYKAIGPPGTFAATMLEDLLRRADRAASEQDTVAMLRLYEEMTECQ